jgi:hypothetical protein
VRRRSLLVPALVGLLVAGCGLGAAQSPIAVPPPSRGPQATVSGAVDQTRAAMAAALAGRNLELAAASREYRTGEPRALAAAPRRVYQVGLPDDPEGGFIVVYEFRDSSAAVDAGNALAGYLGTGAGRIQYPIDSRYSIRQLGTTLIFYTWAPSTSPDPASATIGEALDTLGIGFAPPR